jgi:hypothetical protein
MNQNLTALYELLLDQQQSIRNLTLQLEGLKAMMFEHRPPFVDAHAAQVSRLTDSAMVRSCDQRIVLMEALLQDLKVPIS